MSVDGLASVSLSHTHTQTRTRRWTRSMRIGWSRSESERLHRRVYRLCDGEILIARVCVQKREEMRYGAAAATYMLVDYGRKLRCNGENRKREKHSPCRRWVSAENWGWHFFFLLRSSRFPLVLLSQPRGRLIMANRCL